MTAGVAVVGLACRYPEADNPEQLWENVLSQRRAFRRLPPERLRLEDYWSPDPQTPDMTYSQHAALLEDWTFDRVRHRISGTTYRATDPTHWLALDMAGRALADAGLDDFRAVSRDRVGVVVGNTLTGEFSRSNLLRLRWPYVRRVLQAALEREGWDVERRSGFLATLEQEYKAPFAPVGEDSLAGGLSNTIAGRICNAFDLHGGGYTVDGACASSLLALIHAASAVEAGELDLALAGGVDLSMDPFELVGFAKTNALARERMRVYDRRAEGFWPGEGCGFVALVRHSDALAWGARIYAVVRGWGIASDGRGGLTRPEQVGQELALRRAYQRAGYDMGTVALFEGHGTGTAVGDATELATLDAARRTAGAQGPPAAIGSVKANIGHTKAAAGIAGFLKAVLSVQRQVVPPTTGCDDPDPRLTAPDARLRVVREPELWPADLPLRAGVNAMGFGGIDTHVTVEGAASGRRRSLVARERALGATYQDYELLPLAAADAADLAAEAEQLAAAAGGLGFGDLRDLAIQHCAGAPRGVVRAAVLADSPAQLEQRLSAVASLARGGTLRHVDARGGVFLGTGETAPRIGLLFPGQAAPTSSDGGAVGRRFPQAAQVLAAARLSAGPDVYDTAVAQPAIVAASAAGLAVLRALGLEADVAVGHSLGELTALHWAGVLEAPELVDLARARGRAMADLPGERGTMADLSASADVVQDLLEGLPVVVAAYNAHDHTVVSGPQAAVAAVLRRARERGVPTTSLSVSHAFHSPLVAGATDGLARVLDATTLAPLRRRVLSTVEGGPLDPAADVRELLLRQVTAPVRFAAAAAAAAGEVDLLLEIGPGRILTGLLHGQPVPVVATQVGDASLAGFLAAVGAAWALGAPVRMDALACERVARSAEPLRTRAFLANPCELAPADVALPAAPATGGDASSPAPGTTFDATTGEHDEPLEVVRRLIAARAELPLEAVTPVSGLLSDLNLNSITVAHIAADAAATLAVQPPLAPTELATATVGDLARLLAEAEPAGAGADVAVAGVASWLRPFALDWVPRPKPPDARSTHEWRLLAPDAHPLRPAAEAAFRPGSGGERALLILAPMERTPATAAWLLAAVQQALDPGLARVAVLTTGSGGALVRTLAQERPALTVRLVELPSAASGELLAAARAEADSGRDGFAEIRLGSDGERSAPELRVLDPAPGVPRLASGDVLLVTGGGKGIGAEAALGLARASGAAVAVLGRSAQDGDPELAANLERMRAHGVRMRYVRADVTDGGAVRAAVAEVEAALGPVTAVLHAAGRNEPRALGDLDTGELAKTLDVKVDGLAHVLSCIAPERLRLLVAFGSIIGRMGLHGEGDYALANEWLRLSVEEAAARLPNCRCLTVEWSVWSGVGMGERLGRIEILARAGVTPIPVEEGVALLQRLVDAAEVPPAVIATGRFGAPATLRVPQVELPLLRFLEQPRVHHPGIELVCDAVLSAAADRYLDDHVLDGLALFPGAAGLEAMAQVAGALLGGPVLGFTDVEFQRGITVPPDGQRTIRIAALARDDGRADVEIRSDETQMAALHFRATCLLRPPTTTAVEVAPTGPVALDVERELYGRLLFHGPRFHRVRGYTELRARRSLVQIEADPDATWFSDYLPPRLVLGDLAARDAAIHAQQACVPHWRFLPLSVKRIAFASTPGGASRTVAAVERHSDERTLVFDMTVRDEDGAELETWEGLTLRAIAPLPATAAWPPALFVPYLERRLGELLAPALIAVQLQPGGGEGWPQRQRRTDAVLAGALSQPAKVLRRPDGKPEVPGAEAVSAAHRAGLTLAVAGGDLLACDLEEAQSRGPRVWEDLLGERFPLAMELAREAAESLDLAATRVWVAGECIRKTGGSVREPLTLETAGDGWAVLRAGELRIATVGARLVGVEHPMVVGVASGTTEPRNGARPVSETAAS